MEHWPVEVDPDKFARNLRSARKGAPGPSGMTSEHLRPLLSHPNDVLMLHPMGEELARGQVPQVVIEAIRVGRMTALQKPDGGVRGIVAGDILRRLVGRTIAQQINPIVSDARRLSSTPSRHVLELSVCRTHCKPSQRQSPRRQ